MSGDDTTNQTGVYGIEGTTEPAANKSRARRNASSWTDDLLI
jgi:hypothetical protein